jgi:oligopeptide transport system substrate-binding protein
MIRILTILAVLIVIAIGAMFLFQGGSPPQNPTDQTGPAAPADNGQVIEPPGPEFVYISGAEADTLDPMDASWLTDFRMIECLFETLLRIETKHMTLEGGAAEKWEVSPDKLTYTFHIRPDAKWSNGDPLTAQDFIFGWMRVLNPDAAAPYYNLMLPIKGAKAWYEGRQADTDAYRKGGDKSAAAAQALWQASVKKFHDTVGVVAKDDKTLVVTLEQPVAYFLELVAFPTFSPVHRKSVEPLLKADAASGLVELSDKTHFITPGVISNGPYVLKERKLQQHTRFSPNPHFWNARRVANKGILCRIIETTGAMLLEYQSGGVHWLPDIPTNSPEAAQLVQQKNAGLRKDVHVEPAAGTYFYHFNCKPVINGKPNVLADPRVRRALSMAIDRETIVTKVTRMNQPVAMTITPIGSVPGYAPPVHAGIAFNPSGARQLLAEAGFPGGKGFPDEMKFAYNTNAGHELIAQFVTGT